jgi:serine/threonine protein phosphatase PrpC
LTGRFVVCSDGVHSELADAGIAAVASLALPPSDIAHRLVDSALEVGGHDNITVVVVDVLPRKTPATGADTTDTGDTLTRGTVKEWSMSVIGPNEDIDSLNDSTLETLRTTQAQDNDD